MLQPQKGKLPTHAMLTPLQPTEENTQSLFVVTIHGYQTLHPSRNVNSNWCARHKTQVPEVNYQERNLLVRSDLREECPQTVLFQTGQG